MTSASFDLFRGDTLTVLRALPDDSVDSIVTDPPYGLSKEPDIAEVLRHWLAGDDYVHTGSGFMGKTWDSFVPGPSVFREALRVLKPGGHLVCFAGSRTVDLMGISIRLAGFEIRDQMQWIYGSGFPKSMDVSKAIDSKLLYGGSNTRNLKRVNEEGREGEGRTRSSTTNNGIMGDGQGVKITRDEPATPEGAAWKGWGTALKPGHEPIVLARKPLVGTVAANVLAHGTGAINIDGSRVGTTKDVPASVSKHEARPEGVYEGNQDGSWGNEVGGPGSGHDPLTGRWPANVILSHHPECVEVGLAEVQTNSHHPASRGEGGVSTSGHSGQADLIERPSGTEVVERWECHADCPLRMMDEQSGERKAGGKVKGHEPSRTGDNGIYNQFGRVENTPFTDKGGASRFFYCAKASRSERNEGVSAPEGNRHPTVKPIKLMSYLVGLVTPEGGTCLDMYLGSGTTLAACAEAGFDGIGIDRDDEGTYLAIAQDRIENRGGSVRTWEVTA